MFVFDLDHVVGDLCGEEVCPQDVPMLLMLTVHSSRRSDLLSDDTLEFLPKVQARSFRDAFGNICTRLTAPTGLVEISSDFVIADSGRPDGA